MRGQEFLDKMELIEPAYVEAADIMPKKKKSIWIKCGAAAACLCLAIAGFIAIGQQNEPSQTDLSGLPPITIPELAVGGMGFEGDLYHDISELKNENPWSESSQITALPVYKNGFYDATHAGIPLGLNEAEMRERLDSAASALKLEILSTTLLTEEDYTSDASSTVPTEIHAKTDNGELQVYANGNIVYLLPDEGLALPEEYAFTYSGKTDAEAEEVLAYLSEYYADLLNFEEPKLLSYGDYDIYGNFDRRYIVYDAADDDTQDILNYNLRYARFSPSETGKLYAIYLYDALAVAEKIGDYPIITAEEATERLISGQYQTSAPAEFPGEKFIGKVELIYRSSSSDEMLLPYYRFYVLLSDEYAPDTDNGLKTYAAYYVPAIADEYIAGMPTYDGRFNG